MLYANVYFPRWQVLREITQGQYQNLSASAWNAVVQNIVREFTFKLLSRKTLLGFDDALPQYTMMLWTKQNKIRMNKGYMWYRCTLLNFYGAWTSEKINHCCKPQVGCNSYSLYGSRYLELLYEVPKSLSASGLHMDNWNHFTRTISTYFIASLSKHEPHTLHSVSCSRQLYTLVLA